MTSVDDSDLFNQLGVLAIGSRLKRLSDKIMLDGAKIYDMMQIPFEPRWFPVTFALSQQRSPVGMTDLARQLGLTHPAVNQVIKEMANNGMIAEFNDKHDKRKRQVMLSDKGMQVWQQAQPTLQLIEHTLNTVLGDNTLPLFNTLHRLEQQFNQVGFFNTAQSIYNQTLIVDYSPVYKPFFKSLNEAWITTFFTLEPADIQQLSQPEACILDKGGHILFAVNQGEVIGTCALVPHDDQSFELTKMAVDEKAQGKKAGQALVKAAIDKARQLNAKTMWLETNSTLKPAIHIYEKLGFQHVAREPHSKYQRADVRMTLDLKAS